MGGLFRRRRHLRCRATAILLATSGMFVCAGAAPPAVASSATPIDLGTLGGTGSTAAAVSGNIVVGNAGIAGGGQHAFAYDLATSTMRDLGTLGGSVSYAADISGSTVVGGSTTAVGAAVRSFTYDLTTSTMRDIGTLGGTQAFVN